MPKERLHILLAEEALKVLKASGSSNLFDEEAERAYLLGAVFPDVLFYDLPSFRLSYLGGALHVLEGEAGTTILKDYFHRLDEGTESKARAWLFGVIAHFIADGFWHPYILKLTSQTSPLCLDLNLSTKDCHHWLESEIEAFWLNSLGPSDGYLPLLRTFQRDAELIRKCISTFRDFLQNALPYSVPSTARIRRSLFWQLVLLRQFAHPFWTVWKSQLTEGKSTRCLGALIVPALPNISTRLNCHSSESDESLVLQKLLDGRFMAMSVMLTATRLHELAMRF